MASGPRPAKSSTAVGGANGSMRWAKLTAGSFGRTHSRTVGATMTPATPRSVRVMVRGMGLLYLHGTMPRSWHRRLSPLVHVPEPDAHVLRLAGQHAHGRADFTAVVHGVLADGVDHQPVGHALDPERRTV